MQVTHDLAVGGLQQVVVNLARSIDRNIFDVSVLCLRSTGEFCAELEQEDVEVILLPQKEGGVDYFSFLKVGRILKEKHIDVIHTHNTQPFIDGTLGALMAGVKTIIHTDHARDFPDKKRYMFAEWFASNFAYKVVGVSEHTSKNLRKYEHISARKIETIPNGVYGKRFAPSIDIIEKKKELGIAENHSVLGVTARLSEQKGVSYLLQAFKKVSLKFPNTVLLIVGDGPLRKELEDESQSLGLTKKVKFLGIRLDIPELLKVFDLYVLPSLWEGLPMAILEAMAARCPIVATDVGGVHIAIKHGFNGSLVESENVDALAGEIIKVLLSNDLMVKYQENGMVVFQEQFSAEIMTRQYELLYLKKSLVKGK